MSFEVIEHNGKRYAEIIWVGMEIDTSTFFSPPEASFQFGLLAHKSGFIEPAHYHKPIERKIQNLQQMFVVQKGVIAVEFYDDNHQLFKQVRLGAGDAISLMDGIHAIRVIEDMQCISVKQGPFLGDENDKIEV